MESATGEATEFNNAVSSNFRQPGTCAHPHYYPFQILSDVIASFSLAFDNNFSTGDKIVVFGEEGVVASMGMRSTKITLTYSGEELCMPNSKVASEIVKTYSVFKERRAELEFVISKDTENVKLLAICDHVGEVRGSTAFKHGEPITTTPH